MADQIRFEQQRFEKLKNHLEHEEEETSKYFKPQISKGSEKILKMKKLEETQTVTTHDRLYSTKSSQQVKNVLTAETITFQPNINKKSQMIKREGKIEEVLYSEAKKRQQKMRESEKSTHQFITEEQKAKQFNKSIKLVFARFETDFTQIAQNSDFNDKSVLTYSFVCKFMSELGFYNEESAQHKALMSDLWRYLKGEEHRGVQLRNLKVFLAAIMNFNFPWMKAHREEEAPEAADDQ